MRQPDLLEFHPQQSALMTAGIAVDYLCLMIDEGEDTVYLQTFGRRLAALRVQRGLSQEELAEASGLGPGEVRRVERGQRDLSVIALADIARALDIQPADLMP
jgi:ribosome-binding protein aMBF1 (putative translation factor)